MGQDEATNSERSRRGVHRQGQRWQALEASVRDKHQLPSDARPWTSRPGVQLRGLADSERQRGVLDVGFAVHQKRNPGLSAHELTKILWANPSQSLDRMPVTTTPATLTTSTELYSFAHDTVLSGEAVLRGMGWPRGYVPAERFTEAEVRNLAGECYSAPVMAQVAFAYYLNPWAPWWQRQQQP